ncbi:MAG: DUF1573 domain-containing protein [Opitutaceae bacterium]|nr:DUF1573 domain-containing protein [Verrucomicrobiales bacterium]
MKTVVLFAVFAVALINSTVNAQPFGQPGVPAAQPAQPAVHPLVWDAMIKEYNAKVGDTTNVFAFSVTNNSNAEVVINQVRPSCGCTIAELPSNPWKLAPGASGTTYATISFVGKTGVITKSLYVDSTAGAQTLMIRVNVPEQTGDMGNRLRNQQLALADRQAVFKGDCAVCHAAPAVGKMGEPLYQAACAICHAPEHRASMVPDLAVARSSRDTAFWTEWVANGRDKTLMPGFSKTHGGPLTDEQVQSLVSYAMKKFPLEPAPSPVVR